MFCLILFVGVEANYDVFLLLLSVSHPVNTVLSYREVLGLTIGARVCAQYESLSRGLHRTWLHLCYGITAHLLPPDPVLQYKVFSTRLATVSPASEQLNALRFAISCEPSTRGAQILWNRQVLVLIILNLPFVGKLFICRFLCTEVLFPIQVRFFRP